MAEAIAVDQGVQRRYRRGSIARELSAPRPTRDQPMRLLLSLPLVALLVPERGMA